MDIYDAFAISFLGLFAVYFLYCLITNAALSTSANIARWLTRHLVWPTVFLNSRHAWDPTRAQLLVLVAHWSLVAFYNFFRVETLSQASAKAAQLSLLHIIPLLIPSQVAFVSYILDISLHQARVAHIMLGTMAIFQGTVRFVLEVLQRSGSQRVDVPGATVRSIMWFL